MIITIDGPAGAGKSTVARALATRLGYQYLDTGAMYRTVALAGWRRGVDWSRPAEVAKLVPSLDIEIRGQRVFLGGEDVSHQIRTSEVTAVTRYAADDREIRRYLTALQRRVASRSNIVTEGRDQGTQVFPEAECKIFLTADAQERARRRLVDLRARGERVTLEEVLRAQQQRDREDQGRTHGPLSAAEDAIEVCTDGRTIDEVVDYLESLVPRTST